MRKMIFKQSITIEKLISKDMYGSGNYEEPVTVPDAIDYIIKNIKGIALPDGSKPYIGSIAPVFNHRNGSVHYIEVYVSRARPGED